MSTCGSTLGRSTGPARITRSALTRISETLAIHACPSPAPGRPSVSSSCSTSAVRTPRNYWLIIRTIRIAPW